MGERPVLRAAACNQQQEEAQQTRSDRDAPVTGHVPEHSPADRAVQDQNRADEDAAEGLDPGGLPHAAFVLPSLFVLRVHVHDPAAQGAPGDRSDHAGDRFRTGQEQGGRHAEGDMRFA